MLSLPGHDHTMTEEQDEGRDAMLSARLEQAQCWVGEAHKCQARDRIAGLPRTRQEPARSPL